jgi:hypothetical protein
MTDWLWATLLLTGFLTWIVVPAILAVRVLQKRLDTRPDAADSDEPARDQPVDAAAIDLRIWQDLRDRPRRESQIG